MLRLASYDIVFQEVPGEVTLALNLSGCPNRCPGCHSSHLQQDSGEILDEELFADLLHRYTTAVTCICFMGGDGDPASVDRLADIVRQSTAGRLKTAWYSGKASLPEGLPTDNFDYIKLGPYIKTLGGLDSPTTNQRFMEITRDGIKDRTEWFQSKR